MLEKFKNLFRKKKVITIKDFSNRVREIAVQYDRPYYSTEVKYAEFLRYGGSKEWTFIGYIDGFGSASGKTVDEVCKKLRAVREGKKDDSNIEDVVIDG